MSEMTHILVEAADRVFAQAKPCSHDAALWQRVADSGFDRLLLSEDQGGSGDAYADAAVIASRQGRRAAAIPLVETMVANYCLARAGLAVPDGPKALLIAPEHSLTVDRTGAVCAARPITVGFEAVAASRVAVALRDGAPCIALIGSALAGEAAETVAGEPCTVFSGRVVPDAVAPWTGAPQGPLALLALLKAAAIAGAAETAVTLAIDYANLRVQFGRKIGAFQAIQHMIARMAAEAAATSAAVQHAGQVFAESGGLFACAAAKGRASEAAGKIAAAAHQVHGAIGFTAEHDLHRFTRRLWCWRDDAGNEGYWYDRLGHGALREGPGLWAGITAGYPL